MTNRARYIMKPQFFLVALAAAVMAYLTLVPLVMLIYGSIKSGPPGAPGHFTVKNYLALFDNWRLAGALFNSLVFSTGSSLLAFAGGLYLAWITERTNVPWRRTIYACVLAPMIVPGILTTVGWIILFGRRSGIINIIATQYFGFDQPIEINNMPGMIWVQGTDQIPLAFLLLAAALRSMDPSLEEAAMVAGSGVLRTTYRITARVLLPAILAVWMISFVRAIENFEVPALIGMPAGILVFATEVYLATKNVPTDFGLASTFGVVYLGITALGVVLYLRWTAASEQFATITGKGYRPTVFDLGRWRKPMAAVSLFVCLILFILPILVVVWSSFLPFYMAPSRNALVSLTLENYQTLWRLPLVHRAMWNSFVLGIASSTITMVLTAIVAWIIVRTQWRGKGSLDFLAFSPIAMPGLVLGIAILWLYLVLPVPVYGTLWILLIAYVTKYLPYGMRACSSSMLQIKKELEEASEASGAAWSHTFRRVILPLLAPGFVAGWIYVITHSFRELSTSIMLYRSGTEVISIVLFELWDGGQYPQLAALGMVLVAILIAISLIARAIGAKYSVQQI
ncbi:MAG: iron ABC transporter permease [Deltaproteobacteria bacterium]|nr:iron ABC transporter permease [Deltaproteobacteria bacterium]MBI3066129.1 iron ABC transporter permease [Deltaproteobacteria bacterium]